jgi:hypothetical protein
MAARRERQALTPARKEAFLRELARHGVAARAAREASPGSLTGALQTFKDERHRDAEFDEAWNEAIESAHADLLHELIRRAKDGTNETVYGPSGQPIGNRKRYSDRLLLEAVRARFPEFTPRQQVEQSTTMTVKSLHLDRLSPESRAELRRILEREQARATEGLPREGGDR